MTFKTELAEIEKELKKSIKLSDYVQGFISGKREQLLKDQEIHEKIMKEFVEKLKDEIIENDIYTADEIFRIINKLYEEMK